MLTRSDESFTSYRTPLYKLHLFETPTSYRFVLLSDPSSDSLRFVLRQLYVGPFVEYVARNPLVQMDSRTEGIDNDQVRGAVLSQLPPCRSSAQSSPTRPLTRSSAPPSTGISAA